MVAVRPANRSGKNGTRGRQASRDGTVAQRRRGGAARGARCALQLQRLHAGAGAGAAERRVHACPVLGKAGERERAKQSWDLLR